MEERKKPGSLRRRVALALLPAFLLPSCRQGIDIFEKTPDTTTRFWVGEEIRREDVEDYPWFEERYSKIRFEDPEYFLPAGIEEEQKRDYGRVVYSASPIGEGGSRYRVESVGVFNTREVSIYGLKVGDYKDVAAKKLYPLGFYYYNSYNHEYIFLKDALGIKVKEFYIEAAYLGDFPGEALPSQSSSEGREER